MADRRRLRNRRISRIVEFEYGNIKFDVGWSPDPETLGDGPQVLEIFVTPKVAENQLHQECAAFSTTVSIALQRGATLKEIRDALPKHSTGKPTTWGGEALSAIARDIAMDDEIIPTRPMRDVLLETILAGLRA